ncbi:transposase [Rhodococcus sp. UFZ-B548]|uniref:transposase n=1 Tax=Rhodococcus sp. UFZ-B548 TaxID=2742212 RepID=UPI0037CC263E
MTAAKILDETADSTPRMRLIRHDGTAPLPAYSSNHARHRLSRNGNRRINASIHRITLAQARYYPPGPRINRLAQKERRRRHGSTPDSQMSALQSRFPYRSRRPVADQSLTSR